MKEVRKGSKFFGTIKKERKEKTKGDVEKRNRINLKFPTTTQVSHQMVPKNKRPKMT